MGLKNIVTFMRKELLHLKRDPRTCALLIIVPIMNIMILNYAFGGLIEEIPTVIANGDGGHVADIFISALNETDTFDLIIFEENMTEDDAKEFIVDGEADLVIFLPSGLSQSVDEGEMGNITVIMDGTEVNTALAIKKSLAEVMENVTQTLLDEKLGEIVVQTRPINFNFDVVYGENIQYVDYITPPVVALTVTFVCIMVTVLSIIREKTVKTLERILFAPVRGSEILLGKLFATVLVAIGEICLILSVSVFLLHMHIAGSVVSVFFVSLLIGCGGLGLGLAVSSITKKEREAMMVIPAYVIPSVLLSGFFWPIEAIRSPVMRKIAEFIPLTYANRSLRAIMVKGLSISSVLPEIMALAVFAIATLVVGILMFRREMVVTEARGL